MLSSVFDLLSLIRGGGDISAVSANVTSALVQIHAEAYMLTLVHIVSQPYSLLLTTASPVDTHPR